ncbi:MAG TPA: hypothetical protein VF303_02475 [Candidatus Nanoarchaeia archaeon]
MGGNNFLSYLFWRLSRISPLAWAFILFGIALILVRFESDFIKKLAIPPTIIGLLLFYQAIFRGKMY